MTFALDPDARVHLVGIGGAGMSALAWILLERGHPVSGSDLRGGRGCAALAAMGADIAIGHDAENVAGAEVVAASTAVPDDNPELRRAAALGLPVLRRAELLAALIGDRTAVLIAGTHGKTTTTAMVTVCLQTAGLDPSFAIGGTLHDAGTSAHHGSGPLFVAETDESDRSFLVFEGDCAVVTNIELDHHDHYENATEFDDAFVAFLARRKPDAPAIVCLDDPGVRNVIDRVEPPVVTYGTDPAAVLRVTDVALEPAASSFRLARDGEDLGEFQLRLTGLHNVRNAAAAVGVALWAGADPDEVRQALQGFGGTQRRFQKVGIAGGVTVVDDYGHHPTELRATIAAARQTRPAGRVVAVFQPHRFSRTAALGPELGRALAAADLVVVTDIYAAGETPVPGVTGEVVADAARAAGADTWFVPSIAELPEIVAGLVRDGDLVLTLGAGDITEAGPVLIRRLSRG